MTGHFEFHYPWALALLALLPVYAYLRGKVGKWSALKFSSADIARAAGKQARAAAGRWLAFLRLLTAALGIMALAGPRMANYHVESEAAGIDIMLVLDVSYSMMALDMAPPGEHISRFDIASKVLEGFIRKRPNDRMGLIVFSGVPYLASPLTLDHHWLIRNLRRLHVGVIHKMQELGTAIGDAIVLAAKRLKAVPRVKSRVIILLTDGDNNRGEIDPLPAAQLAAALGAKIYTVGIGVEKPCYLPAFDPDTGNLQLDSSGHIIPTMLLQPANFYVLSKISALSGAESYRAANRRQLQNIYNEIDHLEKSKITIKRYATYRPLFQWPLLAAFILLAVELILANTRFRRAP